MCVHYCIHVHITVMQIFSRVELESSIPTAAQTLLSQAIVTLIKFREQLRTYSFKILRENES